MKPVRGKVLMYWYRHEIGLPLGVRWGMEMDAIWDELWLDVLEKLDT